MQNITNQKTYRWYMNVSDYQATSSAHGVSKQHAYLISYLTNDCLHLMSTVAIYIVYYIVTTAALIC